MKIDDLFGCYRLIGNLQSMKIPVSMSIVLEDNFRKIDPIMQDAEKKRKAFEASDNYKESLDELLNTDVDISLSKIPMETLEKCDSDSRYDVLSYDQVSIIRKFMLKEYDTAAVVFPE